MASVVVWGLEHDQSPAAVKTKVILVRLSDRSMKANRPVTVPVLLVRYMVLLAMQDPFTQTDFDINQLQQLANQALPFKNSS